jgi:hypothetical protein
MLDIGRDHKRISIRCDLSTQTARVPTHLYELGKVIPHTKGIARATGMARPTGMARATARATAMGTPTDHGTPQSNGMPPHTGTPSSKGTPPVEPIPSHTLNVTLNPEARQNPRLMAEEIVTERAKATRRPKANAIARAQKTQIPTLNATQFLKGQEIPTRRAKLTRMTSANASVMPKQKATEFHRLLVIQFL